MLSGGGLQELNLRRVVFTNEEHPLTVLSARPDAPALGRRLGGKFKAVAAAVRPFPPPSY